MATKPKQTVNTKEGTLTHVLLNYLINDCDEPFESKAAAADFLTDEFGINVRSKKLSEIINWFNEGLYNVNGKTLSNNGPIIIGSGVVQHTFSPTPEILLGRDEEPEGGGVKTFEDICREKNIDPTDVAEFWTKDKGLSVKMKRKGDDEVREWNKDIERAREAIGKAIEGSNLTWEKPHVDESPRVGVYYPYLMRVSKLRFLVKTNYRNKVSILYDTEDTNFMDKKTGKLVRVGGDVIIEVIE